VFAVRILSTLAFFVLVGVIDGVIIVHRVKRQKISTYKLELRLEGGILSFHGEIAYLTGVCSHTQSLRAKAKIENFQ
jgi:hypothetical protein